jgi:hypothetical protein
VLGWVTVSTVRSANSTIKQALAAAMEMANRASEVRSLVGRSAEAASDSLKAQAQQVSQAMARFQL